MPKSKKMIVLESAYTYKMMQERGLIEIVTGKELNGYFDKVWTCHPNASLLFENNDPEKFGKPIIRNLSSNHKFIEGKIGKYKFLEKFEIINFLLAFFELIKYLRELIIREEIQIIRSESPHLNGIIAYILSFLTKKDFIVGVWGNPKVIRKHKGKPLMPKFFKRMWIEIAVEKFILNRAKYVMVQNYNNRNFVLDCGIKKSKVIITRFGELLNSIHFSDPKKREEGKSLLRNIGVKNKNNVLIIGSLIKEKLPEDVLKAALEMKRKNVLADFIYCGDGPFKNEIIKTAKKFNILDQIIFCGNKSQDWLSRVIPEVSTVVSLSTGRALAEAALGAGKIAAYDLDWHAELIQTGKTGELVPYSDWQELANAIIRIINDPLKYSLLGDYLREITLKKFDPEFCISVQKELYNQLL